MFTRACWQCDECGIAHEYEDDAKECCAPTVSPVFVCGKCDDVWQSEIKADACCAEPKVPGDEEIRNELESRGQLRLIE